MYDIMSINLQIISIHFYFKIKLLFAKRAKFLNI